jgi:hypothetical protein
MTVKRCFRYTISRIVPDKLGLEVGENADVEWVVKDEKLMLSF